MTIVKDDTTAGASAAQAVEVSVDNSVDVQPLLNNNQRSGNSNNDHNDGCQTNKESTSTMNASSSVVASDDDQDPAANAAAVRANSARTLGSGTIMATAQEGGGGVVVVQVLQNQNRPTRTDLLLASSTSADSRFGGLAGRVEASIASSIDHNGLTTDVEYHVTAEQLGILSDERTRLALADVLEQGVQVQAQAKNSHKKAHDGGDDDVEKPSSTTVLVSDVMQLVEKIRQAEKKDDTDTGGGGGVNNNNSNNNNKKEYSAVEAKQEAEKNADMAANVLTEVLLHSNVQHGIDPREVEHRKEIFGSNAITSKNLDSFLALCWEAVQDFVLIMLIVLGVISIVVETTTHQGDCSTCWIEGAAILCSVCIVVLVTAGIDYAKQFAFIKLTRNLHDTNTKAVIRDGKQVSVIDDDIVVGDILSVNSHNLASIPADCVLLGPPAALKMDESSLTGESVLVAKKPGDVVLSGTTAVQGSGKMVVIAVGVNSVAGKIRARVYESEDHEDELGDGDENSPLFVKLDLIAKQIGVAGTVAATVAFAASCIIGLAVKGDDVEKLVDYLIVAITVLAVAVPEGLPLAVTLALAFSSNKMMQEQNLVKHLDACETMGCATTICTDKTGKYCSLL